MTRKQYIPHGYQGLITGHELEQPRDGVWSFMGSGKTVATLTALDILTLSGETDPALIVAPLRVAKNTWPSEADKWEHLRGTHIIAAVGNPAERMRALTVDASAYSINFENIVWLIEYYGDRWPFKTVIWDESTRLSGFRLKQGTKQARALARVAHTKIKRFIQLTGTPAPNGLQKLWGQLWFLDRGYRLGSSFDAFYKRWFYTDYAGVIQQVPHAQEEIQRLVRDLCMSVLVEDWFPDLEAPLIRDVVVELPIKARAQYREMEKHMFAQIGDRTAEAFGAAARTQKCLQLASGAVYVDPEATDDNHPNAKEWREVHDLKLQALESIVEEMNGEPILVAYEFRSDLYRILKAFPKARVLDTYKSTEDAWNAGKIPMLVCHPKSAGHGLNLQDGGRTLVYFTSNWNLELHQQIAERLGPVRQMQSGHKRKCLVYRIVAADTFDEDVLYRLDGKRTIQDALLRAMAKRGKR